MAEDQEAAELCLAFRTLAGFLQFRLGTGCILATSSLLRTACISQTLRGICLLGRAGTAVLMYPAGKRCIAQACQMFLSCKRNPAEFRSCLTGTGTLGACLQHGIFCT